MNANRIFLVLFCCAIQSNIIDAQTELSIPVTTLGIQSLTVAKSSLSPLSLPILTVMQNEENGVYGLTVATSTEETQRFVFTNPISKPVVRDGYVYLLETKTYESVLRTYQITETGKLQFSSLRKLAICHNLEIQDNMLIAKNNENLFLFDLSQPNRPDFVRISSPMAERLGMLNLTPATVYPNPSWADWHIDLSSFPQGSYTVSISNIEGKMLEKQEVVNENITVANQYPKGTYWYSITRDGLPLQRGVLISNK